MKKLYVLFVILALILLGVSIAFVTIQAGFQDSKNKAYEKAIESPEVIMFYERYNNTIYYHMDLNQVYFEATDENDNTVTLLFYAGNVPPTPKTIIDCTVGDHEYRIEKNVLDYLQNYNCFEDTYNNS